MKKKKKKFMPVYIRVIICLLCILAVTVIILPYIYPLDLGATDLMNRLEKPKFLDPSSQFLLGTDALGRDLFGRILYGLKNSLVIAFSGLILAAFIGIILGILSGLYGGMIDTLVSTLVDVRMSIPTNIIGIICATVFDASKITVVIVIALTGWANFTRLIRAQVMQIKESQFLEASESIGSSKFRIVREHILRNIASPIIIQATLSLNHNIILESTLSFLGLGIQSPDTSLGLLISDGRAYMMTQWWLTICPVIVVVLLIMSVSLFGDWLRDTLDPKMKGRG